MKQQKALHDELATLSRQQSEALQDAIFVSFTHDTAKDYDLRAKRIGEISKLLGIEDLG